jgi:hypothetical protein
LNNKIPPHDFCSLCIEKSINDERDRSGELYRILGRLFTAATQFADEPEMRAIMFRHIDEAQLRQ